MKFRVEDISGEGREENFIQDENWMEERLAGETKRPFHFTGPIKIHLKLSRSGRVILLRSRIEVRVEWICARCLEPFLRTLTSEFTTSLKPKPDFPLPEEVELSREDLETDFYQGGEINVAPLVQDQILLTLPPKAICGEECRGLCPKCGNNLNQEGCQCSGELVDPRLEPLKSFRVQ
ncbi:MAG: DUF177 domain-containing protein [Thermodesulfobacteriota bacterium]|nr:DUF177 domain-containing protein [Thermodesulfobacteriota bacterium]